MILGKDYIDKWEIKFMSRKRIVIFSIAFFFAGLAVNTHPAKAQEKVQEQEVVKPVEQKLYEPRDDAGRTALMRAVEMGDATEVFALLNLGADVEARKESGVTALMNAAGKGRKDILEV